MRTVIFKFRSKLIGSEYKETIEFDDDTPDSEIDAELTTWLYENSDATWYDTDGEQKGGGK